MTAAHDHSLWLGDMRLLAPSSASQPASASRDSARIGDDETVASTPRAVRASSDER